jgi:hypothetical protein
MGVSAMILNFSNVDAFILNMPNPAWKPGIKEDHKADFSDFKF